MIQFIVSITFVIFNYSRIKIQKYRSTDVQKKPLRGAGNFYRILKKYMESSSFVACNFTENKFFHNYFSNIPAKHSCKKCMFAEVC